MMGQFNVVIRPETGDPIYWTKVSIDTFVSTGEPEGFQLFASDTGQTDDCLIPHECSIQCFEKSRVGEWLE